MALEGRKGDQSWLIAKGASGITAVATVGLEGMKHAAHCPMSGNQFATHFDAFEAGMRAVEIARWIPVEEKLPEIGVSVLVVTTPSRYVHDMKLVQREKLPEWRNYFDHNRPEKYYWLHLAGVTHWQPLPAAPEEKK